MDPKETYKEEAYELLIELETSLLELETTPEDKELIGRVFRALHTIKGSGAMFGFDQISKFTHEVETVFDLVRDGKIIVTKELIDLTLAARDQIRKMLEVAEGGEEDSDQEKAEEIIQALKKYLPSLKSGEDTSRGAGILPPDASVPGESPKPPIFPPSSPPNGNVTYRIRFKPHADLFATGTNPILLLDEIRSLGECKVVAQTNTIPLLGDFDPEACYIYWDMILTTGKGLNAIRDVFIFVEDSCELTIDVIDGDGGLDEETTYKKLGEILIERGDLTADDLQKVLASQKRLGEILVDAGLVESDKIQSALAEQEHIRELREKRQKAESVSSIRVASPKLDKLVDLVGELVTVQARLSQMVRRSTSSSR